MAVKAFRLTNFMAFGEWANEDDGWIELRPITLLFGRNSSGKSTILRALRFLRQSLDGGPDGSPFVYSERDGVDVGGFLTMAHRGPDVKVTPDQYVFYNSDSSWLSGKRRVEFAFRLDVPNYQLSGPIPDLQYVDGLTDIELKVAYGWLADANPPRAGLMSAVVQVAEGGPILFEVERLRPDPEVAGPVDWYFGSKVLFDHEGDLKGDLSEQSDDIANADLWDVMSPEDARRGFLPVLKLTDPANWRYANNDMRFTQRLLIRIQSTISDFLKGVEHIRPLRPEPKRVFLLDGPEQERWQRQGRVAYLHFLRNELPSTARTQLNKWLSALELGQEAVLTDFLKAHEAGYGVRPAGVASAVEIVEANGNQVNLGDVGYGAAQVIPVIVQSVLAPEGTLTLIEQPELHLHPRAQAELGDLFADSSAQDRRFLIETHSEHLILRLQRRIREKKIGPNQIGVQYVQRTDGRSLIGPQGLDDEGDLTSGWPEGFFPERFDELFGS